MTLLNKSLNESSANLIKTFYLYCLTAANMHIDLGQMIIQNVIFSFFPLSFKENDKEEFL